MLDLINLTSTKIATALDVSRSAVTQIIRGDRKTARLQERIATVYNVPVNVLFPDRGHGVCKSCPRVN
jgi:transcriptional regulator with XRE-family HTH domain